MTFEIDPVEDLAAAVDWFIEVLGPTSARAFGPPEDPEVVETALARIDAAIAPLALPPEIRWLWETWDHRPFDVLPIAGICDPAFALSGWIDDARDGDMPRALFPIGYRSHVFLDVDLTAPPGVPAPLWSMDYEGDGYTLELPSLAALVRSCAECAEAAQLGSEEVEAARTNPLGYLSQLFAGPRFSAIADRHRAAASVTRSTIEFGGRGDWPQPWEDAEQAWVGPSAADGPTHSVAAFEALLATGRPRALLRGTLGTRNSPASGQLLRLTDATGTIEVLLPHDRRPPSVAKAALVEVEVVGRGPLPLPPSTADLEAQVFGSIEDRLRGEHDQAAFEAVSRAYAEALSEYGERVPLVERLVVIEI